MLLMAKWPAPSPTALQYSLTARTAVVLLHIITVRALKNTFLLPLRRCNVASLITKTVKPNTTLPAYIWYVVEVTASLYRGQLHGKIVIFQFDESINTLLCVFIYSYNCAQNFPLIN